MMRPGASGRSSARRHGKLRRVCASRRRFRRPSKRWWGHAREFEYLHWNPVRKGLAARPEDWRWSSYHNFGLDKTVVAACPIQIDYLQLSESYRG